MRLIGYLGFGLTDSSFQSSLLKMGEVVFDMARWSVWGKVAGVGGEGQDRNIDLVELLERPTELCPK